MMHVKKQEISVSPSEAGQKLFQFLLRRFELPKPLIHRWIRTGKIRCNSIRSKPFIRVNEGDIITVPPYHPIEHETEVTPILTGFVNDNNAAKYKHKLIHSLQEQCVKQSKLLQIVYEDTELLVCNKPAGLPTHRGSKQDNSLITIIHELYANNTFKPTPAHRLDKDTSGILLVALSFKSLRQLQEALKNKEMIKEYFAWVEGEWKEDQTIELRHKLEKKYTNHYEKVQTDTGKDSICLARALFKSTQKSLLQIRLITGRTHQIRAQLAAQGFPLYGDIKYGSKHITNFKLHAFRLIVPQVHCFEVLPTWENDWKIETVPTLL